MTIANLGAHASVTGTGTSATTPSRTTQASGSTFVVFVAWFASPAASAPSSIADSKGNTYSINGSVVSDTSLSDLKSAMYVCANGTGGSSHTFTANFGASQTLISVWAAEITGAGSGAVDQQAGGQTDGSSPYTSPTSGTTTQAVEVLVAATCTHTASATETITWSNGFTSTGDDIGDTAQITGSMAYRVVTATGAYTASLTSAGAGTTSANTFLVTLKSTDTTAPAVHRFGSGAFATGSTSVVTPHCDGATSADKWLLTVATKPDTATINTPSGWTKLDEYSGGGGTTGADAGPTKIAVFVKDATGSETTSTTVTVSITSGSSSWAQIDGLRTSISGATWTYGTAGGTDSTTGATVAITCGTDPGLQPGDYTITSFSSPTDVNMTGAANKYSAESLTSSGVTFETFNEISEPYTTTGNDTGGVRFEARVASGTSSGAPTINATAGGTTTNIRGPGVVTRFRASGVTNITPPLLSASSSLLAPALAIALAAPLLSASSSLLAPTITQSGDITPPLLSASSSLLAPTVSVALQAPLLTAAGALLEPVVQQATALQAMPPGPVVPGEFNRRLPPFWPPSEIPRSTVVPVTISPPLLSAASALIEPRVDVALAAPTLAASPSFPAPSVAVGLQAPLISASPSLLSPSVSVGVSAPLLSASSSLPAPRVDVALAPGTLAASSSLLAPGLAVQLQAPLLSASSSLLAPTVSQSQTITPPLLSAAGALQAPSVSVALAPPVLAASSTLLTPTVSQAGTVAPPVLVASSSLLAPRVDVSLSAPVLSAAPALLAPSVGVGVQAPLLAAAPTIPTPRVDVALQAPAFSASSSLLTPGVTVQIQAPLLSATSSLLVPTVSQEQPGDIRPPLLVANGQLLAPTLAIDIQAALLVANSQLLPPSIVIPVPNSAPVRLRSSAPTGPVPLRSSSPSGPIKVR